MDDSLADADEASLSALELERAVVVASEAARSGAEILRGYFRQDGLEARAKARNDLVTRADEESEVAIIRVLRDGFPGSSILAEEGGAEGDGELEWVIDPLDGTSNFVQGLPYYAVSIGLRRGDELLAGVVYEPELDNLFSCVAGCGSFWNGQPIEVSQRPSLDGAVVATGFPFKAMPQLDTYLELFRAVFSQARSIRRFGAAALDHAYTAAGLFDGLFEFSLAPWDVAAGALLIREAGGKATNPEGGLDVTSRGHVVCGGPMVHAQLLAEIARLFPEPGLSKRLASIDGPGD